MRFWGERALAKSVLLVTLAHVLVLAVLASLSWSPTHRTPIEIRDSADDEIPPDHDALALSGSMVEDTFLITLRVEGTVQPSRYIVNVVGRGPGPVDTPHIYKLEYMSGTEESYGIPASREADTLTLRFPLSLVLEGAYIVGLEAVIFGPGDPTDFVQERPREDLRVSSLLPLPFDPILLLGAGVGLVVLGLVGLKKLLTQDQP